MADCTKLDLPLAPDAPLIPDVYEVTLAFGRALAAAPGDRTLLRRWAARYPQFEDDFITVGFGRFALGLDMQSGEEAICG